MAIFQSRYRELSFYVNDRLYSFNDGQFASDETEVISVVEKLTDAQRIDEPKPEVVTEVTEVVAKPATPRKTTGKASAK